jgi:hypothetical protein
LVEEPIGKRLVRRVAHRWENNIRMDLREIEWEGVGWMHLPWDRNHWWVLVNTGMNFQVS